MTKYYVDGSGNYIGAFCGEHGVDLSTYTEVPVAPVSASYIWNGTNFLPPTISLEQAQLSKIQAIDFRTVQLISVGFTYDGKEFSLSTNAQVNWIGMKTLESLISWPLNITTKKDNQHSLPQTELNTFVGTAKGVVQSHLDSGRALKVATNACTTVAEVDAIVDNR